MLSEVVPNDESHRNKTKRNFTTRLICWYILLGGIHELFHVTTYYGLNFLNSNSNHQARGPLTARVRAFIFLEQNIVEDLVSSQRYSSPLQYDDEDIFSGCYDDAVDSDCSFSHQYPPTQQLSYNSQFYRFDKQQLNQTTTLKDVFSFLAEILFGRCVTFTTYVFDDKSISNDSFPSLEKEERVLLLPMQWIINLTRHMGWICSLMLAIAVHYHHNNTKKRKKLLTFNEKEKPHAPSNSISFGVYDHLLQRVRDVLLYLFLHLGQPEVVIAAYVVTLEAISTDLLKLIPAFIPFNQNNGQHEVNMVNNPTANVATNVLCFFCGNFGLILLNNEWISMDGGEKALDLLEEMINVTMMRGAQSGGVVSFRLKQSLQRGKAPSTALVGERCRTVNTKRGDLGIRVRKQIETQSGLKLLSCGKRLQAYKGYPNFTRAFFGHTRFATSSKSNYDGCHPHQWTPTKLRRVYHPFVSHKDHTCKRTTQKYQTTERKQQQDNNRGGGGSSAGGANNNVTRFAPAAETVNKCGVPVGNYVTHNGDFDFFVVRGKSYDLCAIQQWLPLVTEHPMPSTVDSAAIAGIIDLIRTQGCFGLSARFAICFCLTTSKIEANPKKCSAMPTYRQYEVIGCLFESALEVMIERKQQMIGDRILIQDIASSYGLRQELCDFVLEETSLPKYVAMVKRDAHNNTSSNKTDTEGAKDGRTLPTATTAATNAQIVPSGTVSAASVTPKYYNEEIHHAVKAISPYITDEEGGASLYAFVKATVDAFFDNDLLETTKFFLKHAKGTFGICVSSTLDSHRQVCIAAKGQPMSIAFYPRTGLLMYASEQAALKVGMYQATPTGESENMDISRSAGGGDQDSVPGVFNSRTVADLNGKKKNPFASEGLRLDLDDLGGEICLLDWGCGGEDEKLRFTTAGGEHGTSDDIDDFDDDALDIDETYHARNTTKLFSVGGGSSLGSIHTGGGGPGGGGGGMRNQRRRSSYMRYNSTLPVNNNDNDNIYWRLAVSAPNRHFPVHGMMINKALKVVMIHQSEAPSTDGLWQRMTMLENNDLVKPLPKNLSPRVAKFSNSKKHQVYQKDPILKDIHDIPRICSSIQKSWRELSLNRLTAWHLQKCIQQRMDSILKNNNNKRGPGSIDILVTGCEVSLWVGEQFASNLQKAFPKLGIQAVSSNKLLGLFGQELSIPCIGYASLSERASHELQDTIVIIVSHSGGTFAPLACSNLLQSVTQNIFVVSSEWDTQIGKQLRSMFDIRSSSGPTGNGIKNTSKAGIHHRLLHSSRIFSTDVGVRAAEPCSLSVAATHQLLTQLFEHISLTIIGNQDYRRISGAVITEYDLQVLETLNRDNIQALEDIVGIDEAGYTLPQSSTNQYLKKVGTIWSDHVLEQVRAYIMSFIYIFVTVTTGYPIISAIAMGAGATSDWAFYITRFLDSCIYFWLPQINILLIRLVQGRNIRHRMVGRTVVVCDIPWVSQCAEAFLSKIFACSYSIAGLNVLSGNPADHLVHRHTHRVVRGTLIVCGRPDGRLSALTSLESSVCLSVNQASSIQSMGGTCETVTIGHNPFPLPLAEHTITLKRHRPKFLCETLLEWMDGKNKNDNNNNNTTTIVDDDDGNEDEVDNDHGDAEDDDDDDDVMSDVSGEADVAKEPRGTSTSTAKKQDQTESSTTNINDGAKSSRTITNRAAANSNAVKRGSAGHGRNSSHRFDESGHTQEVSSTTSKRKLVKISLKRHSAAPGAGNNDNSSQTGLSLSSRGGGHKAVLFSKLTARAAANNGDDSSDDDKSQTSTSQIMGAYSEMRRQGTAEVNMMMIQHQRSMDSGGSSCIGQDPSHPTFDLNDGTLLANSNHQITLKSVIADMVDHTTELLRLRHIFEEIDTDGDGKLTCKEFVSAMHRCNPNLSYIEAERLFSDADEEMNEELDFEHFMALMKVPEAKLLMMLQTRNRRGQRGLLAVEPSLEPYFGYNLGRQYSPLQNFISYDAAPGNVGGVPGIGGLDGSLSGGGTPPLIQHSTTTLHAPSNFSIIKSQHLAMELYESRIASMQRFVSMTVMFHEMGHRVASFFDKISFGLLRYRCDRSQSMLRIATTASPISGADVRERMETLRLMASVDKAVKTIQKSWHTYYMRRSNNYNFDADSFMTPTTDDGIGRGDKDDDAQPALSFAS